jgi:hypothetical protein
MNIDIAELRAPRQGEEPLNIDRLEQVAAAAGHGHGHRGIGQGPRPWYELEGNVRPSYDIHFIQTFNPQVVKHLLDRLAAAEDTLAAHGLTAPDPETHRIAKLQGRRAAEQAAQGSRTS